MALETNHVWRNPFVATPRRTTTSMAMVNSKTSTSGASLMDAIIIDDDEDDNDGSGQKNLADGVVLIGSKTTPSKPPRIQPAVTSSLRKPSPIILDLTDDEAPEKPKTPEPNEERIFLPPPVQTPTATMGNSSQHSSSGNGAAPQSRAGGGYDPISSSPSRPMDMSSLLTLSWYPPHFLGSESASGNGMLENGGAENRSGDGSAFRRDTLPQMATNSIPVSSNTAYPQMEAPRALELPTPQVPTNSRNQGSVGTAFQNFGTISQLPPLSNAPNQRLQAPQAIEANITQGLVNAPNRGPLSTAVIGPVTMNTLPSPSRISNPHLESSQSMKVTATQGSVASVLNETPVDMRNLGSAALNPRNSLPSITNQQPEALKPPQVAVTQRSANVLNQGSLCTTSLSPGQKQVTPANALNKAVSSAPITPQTPTRALGAVPIEGPVVASSPINSPRAQNVISQEPVVQRTSQSEPMVTIAAESVPRLQDMMNPAPVPEQTLQSENIAATMPNSASGPQNIIHQGQSSPQTPQPESSSNITQQSVESTSAPQGPKQVRRSLPWKQASRPVDNKLKANEGLGNETNSDRVNDATAMTPEKPTGDQRKIYVPGARNSKPRKKARVSSTDGPEAPKIPVLTPPNEYVMKADEYIRAKRKVECPGTISAPSHIAVFRSRVSSTDPHQQQYGCHWGPNGSGCGVWFSTSEYVRMVEEFARKEGEEGSLQAVPVQQVDVLAPGQRVKQSVLVRRLDRVPNQYAAESVPVQQMDIQVPEQHVAGPVLVQQNDVQAPSRHTVQPVPVQQVDVRAPNQHAAQPVLVQQIEEAAGQSIVKDKAANITNSRTIDQPIPPPETSSKPSPPEAELRQFITPSQPASDSEPSRSLDAQISERNDTTAPINQNQQSIITDTLAIRVEAKIGNTEQTELSILETELPANSQAVAKISTATETQTITSYPANTTNNSDLETRSKDSLSKLGDTPNTAVETDSPSIPPQPESAIASTSEKALQKLARQSLEKIAAMQPEEENNETIPVPVAEPATKERNNEIPLPPIPVVEPVLAEISNEIPLAPVVEPAPEEENDEIPPVPIRAPEEEIEITPVPVAELAAEEENNMIPPIPVAKPAPTKPAPTKKPCIICGNIKARLPGDRVIFTCSRCERICHRSCLSSQPNKNDPNDWTCARCERSRHEKPKSRPTSRTATPVGTIGRTSLTKGTIKHSNDAPRPETATESVPRKRKRDQLSEPEQSEVPRKLQTGLRRGGKVEPPKLRERVNRKDPVIAAPEEPSVPEPSARALRIQKAVERQKRRQNKEPHLKPQLKRRRTRSPSLGSFLDPMPDSGDEGDAGAEKSAGLNTVLPPSQDEEPRTPLRTADDEEIFSSAQETRRRKLVEGAGEIFDWLRSDATAKASELENLNRSLEDKIAQLEKEKEDNKSVAAARIEALEDEVRQKNKLAEEASRNYILTEKNLKKSQRELEKKSATIKELRALLDDREKTLQRIGKQTETSSMMAASIIAEKSDLEKRLGESPNSRVQKELEMKTRELETKTKEIEALTAEHQRIEKRLGDENIKLQNTAKAEREAQEKNHAKKLQDTEKKQSIEVYKLTAEIQTIRGELTKTSVPSLKKRIDLKDKKIEEIQNSHAKDVGSLKAKIKKLEADSSVLSRRKEREETDKKHSEQIYLLNSKVDSLKLELAAFKDKAKASEAKALELEQRLHLPYPQPPPDFRAEHEKLKRDNQNIIRTLGEKNDRLCKEKEQIQKRNEQLEKNLRLDFQARISEVRDRDNRIKDLNDAVDKLKLAVQEKDKRLEAEQEAAATLNGITKFLQRYHAPPVQNEAEDMEVYNVNSDTPADAPPDTPEIQISNPEPRPNVPPRVVEPEPQASTPDNALVLEFAKMFNVVEPAMPEPGTHFNPLGELPANHKPRTSQSRKEHYKGWDYRRPSSLHKHRQCDRKMQEVVGTVTVYNSDGSICTAEDDRDDPRRIYRRRGKMTLSELTGLDPKEFVPVVLGDCKKLAFRKAERNKRTGGLSRHAAIYRVGRNVPGELRD